MLVKLDENLGRSHAALVREAGHIVDRVYDEGLSTADDDVIWQRVCEEGRFFITLDLDFSDIRRFPPGTHAGILLLRPRSGERDAVLVVLERVLAEQPLDALAGCLTVADEARTRIRHPEPDDLRNGAAV